jgi:putative phosphoesterase
MKIGLVSDTHGFFDPRLSSLLEGVDHILHAGDIGFDGIIHQLEVIAPVTAVLGNNDVGLNYRETEVLELAGRKFLLHHILVPRSPHEVIRSRIEREAPDVVVFGHSHAAHNELIGRTLYLNPGYAGKPRFRQERSVAILHSEGTELRVEFKTLA